MPRGLRPWSQVTVQEYLRLPLRAHSLLREVPVHDVWRVALPSGGIPDDAGRSRRLRVGEAVAALEPAGARALRAPVAELVASLMGSSRRASRSLVLPVAAERGGSAAIDRTAGHLDGPFCLLYVHPMEAVSEIRNATVHGFLVWALQPAADDYELFWAIHVRPVNAWTAPYLALIDPFRRGVVYPALLRRIHESWIQQVNAAA